MMIVAAMVVVSLMTVATVRSGVVKDPAFFLPGASF